MYDVRLAADSPRAGNRWRISELNESGEGNAYTQMYGFDPFGQPATIKAPDGTQTILTYQGVHIVDRTVQIGTSHNSADTLLQQPATTRETYDAHGRLVQVRDPSMPANISNKPWLNFQVNTDYRYDVGNRLSKVLQAETGAGAVTQTREFSYDLRGFLQWEKHPELGVSGNGQVSYSEYDAGGHAGRKSDGRVNLTYDYDAAERLTAVHEGAGAQRLLKQWSYATQNSGSNYQMGKLIQATRVNWVLDPANPQVGEYGIELTEQYLYQNTPGRVSKRTLFANIPGFPSFDVTYSYDALGNVATVGYPRCQDAFGFPGYYPTNDPARTLAMSYSHGRLSAIPGFLNGLTYHPNGMVYEITHASGLVDRNEEDPFHMRRPRKLTNQLYNEHLLGGPPPEAGEIPNGLGPYEYDGAGNITEVGCKNNFYCRQYHYDLASHLLEDTDPGSTQSYQYDRFGNLIEITTDYGTAVQRDLSTSKTSNHLTGATSYDASGNQLSWGGLSYEWDDFNNLKTLKGLGNHRTYFYTADDERAWTSSFVSTESPDTWTFTVRGLDNKVLTTYQAAGNGPATWTRLKDYVYRNGLLQATELANGTRTYFSLDHLGTPRLLTNASQGYLGDYHYFGFGEAIGGNEPTEVMKFTGHERDSNSSSGSTDDLDYMHARYCNPNLGRFLSADPADDVALDNPQTWNKFTYARNNPQVYTDPTGLEVKVLDSAALELIRLTLPKPLRREVKLGATGSIDRESLSKIRDYHPHLSALQELAQSEKIVEVGTTTTSIQDPGTDFFFESAAEFTEATGIQVDMDNLFLGETLSAAESPTGNLLVNVSDGTGKAQSAPTEELAKTMAHELYGHALFNLRGVPWLHDDGGTVDRAIRVIESLVDDLQEPPPE